MRCLMPMPKDRGMGRPETQLAIRFSQLQIDAIRTKAEEEGIPAGELVRCVLARAGVIEHPDRELKSALIMVRLSPDERAELTGKQTAAGLQSLSAAARAALVAWQPPTAAAAAE